MSLRTGTLLLGDGVSAVVPRDLLADRTSVFRKEVASLAPV